MIQTAESIQTTRYGTDIGANYQRFFVPVIGAPVAVDLMAAASLRPGERVLDVACGTGVIARLAAEAVGNGGRVTGLDLNDTMIAAARAATTRLAPIEWVTANADDLPFDDGVFDVVLSQMGLQFFTNKAAALAEMRRVLVAGGRVCANLPGPTPKVFSVLGATLGRHVDPKAAAFVEHVFGLYEESSLRTLFTEAGFRDVRTSRTSTLIEGPSPEEFLWQYVHSTPLAGPMSQAPEAVREAIERDACPKWAAFVSDGHVRFEVGMTTVTATH